MREIKEIYRVSFYLFLFLQQQINRKFIIRYTKTDF